MQRLMAGLARVITSTFFRRIDVLGTDHVPGHGPVIFACNHPNALMDGWLLTAHCGREPLRFLVHAKLWEYPVLGFLLARAGAIPVRPRAEAGETGDNSAALDELSAVLAGGDSVGIFPEGISHVESRLATIKTGTARVALKAAAANEARVTIVPCGLNYLHRHRFRSQVLLEFGTPLEIGDERLIAYAKNPEAAVRALTAEIAAALASVTLNAPDWNTLRFAQIARRLYKPEKTRLTPAQYIELNRRFLAGYLEAPEDPELEAFRRDTEDYQARLDMLGLKDHQLRKPIDPATAARRITTRGLLMLLLLPLAVPAALVHLPVGWVAAAVGSRFSYEQDDEATLKVFATLALLPLFYLALVILVGVQAGGAWAAVTALLLLVSTLASVRLLEAEASLFLSTVSMLRITRLDREIADLRELRRTLVTRVRSIVDQRIPAGMRRLFDDVDFTDKPAGANS
jgi:glycerol-3-phosphate O-acyltransferase / dihydroxyacetone phosphate acyltransferase